jgi:type IV secretion system protein TrbI
LKCGCRVCFPNLHGRAVFVKPGLPGQIIASVTEDVFDSVSGRHLLLPQGSRLLGQYDSQVAYGQRRVLLVWNRIILPDGSSLVIDRLSGVDVAGYAGLEDGVDWHWRRIVIGAALSTLLGIGAELAAPERGGDSGRVIVATRESAQETVNEIGQRITQRNLNVQPTLTIRPGFQVRVIVGRDLTLRPYKMGVSSSTVIRILPRCHNQSNDGRGRTHQVKHH